MIAWLAKFDIRFYCKQCTEVMRTINWKKKNGIKAINNSSVLETKTSSRLQESMQALFSWWPDTGFLQALKGGISPDYSPAAALLWQQWFLILFPFCIIFVPLQPPTKRINHTTIINTAGQRVLVVGVVLAEGTSGPSPTVLQFTVNIPKTGFFNFILRYKVRLQSRWVCVFATTTHECTLSSDRMIDLPFMCTVKQSNHPKWEDWMVACENSSTGALCL